MEEHAVTTWGAMSAAVSVVGLVLTALLTWMIVHHLMVSLNVTMVAPVLIEWGHFFAVALQIILVNYFSYFDIECIIHCRYYAVSWLSFISYSYLLCKVVITS